MRPRDDRKAHWRGTLRLTGALLLAWFTVSFVLVYHAHELSFAFFGWPFSYWVAGQGALVLYVLIIWFYARAMDRLDRRHGVAEEDD